MKSPLWKIAVFFLAAAVTATGGCSLFSREVKSKYVSVRTDVFAELEPASPPDAGYVNLEIKASIKKDLNAEPEYPFVFNVDGQAARWTARGREETLPVTESAEGGNGMKYSIDRTLRLAEGHHDIFFAAPEDDYSVEFDVNLKGGRTYTLEFVPLYHYSPAREHISNFQYGIYRFNILLNGKR